MASSSNDHPVTIPIHEEDLRVDTREVDTGRGVRVHKRVRSAPATVSRELAHDELEVRRVPVGRVVAQPPATRYEGETLVVPVLEEVLVVEKRYRIKEEVRITRHKRRQRYSTEADVRSEDVTVERFTDSPPSTRHAERNSS